MDPVSIDTIVRAVKAAGSDAVVEGDKLKLYPKDGKAIVYTIPPGGFGRRLIIQIGKRASVPSHHFWHPEMIQDRPPSAPPPGDGEPKPPSSRQPAAPADPAAN